MLVSCGDCTEFPFITQQIFRTDSRARNPHISGMADTTRKALKKLRERAGYTVRELAKAIGMGASSYAYYEQDYKKEVLPLPFVKKLLPALTSRGVPEEDVVALAGVTEIRDAAIPESAVLTLETAYRAISEIAQETDLTLSSVELDQLAAELYRELVFEAGIVPEDRAARLVLQFRPKGRA